MLIERSFSQTLRANREWTKPSFRNSYSKSLTRFCGLEDNSSTNDSILYEITFPLKQIYILLSSPMQSEPYVQLIEEFMKIAQV